jgi:hypothetical protein
LPINDLRSCKGYCSSGDNFAANRFLSGSTALGGRPTHSIKGNPMSLLQRVRDQFIDQGKPVPRKPNEAAAAIEAIAKSRNQETGSEAEYYAYTIEKLAAGQPVADPQHLADCMEKLGKKPETDLADDIAAMKRLISLNIDLGDDPLEKAVELEAATVRAATAHKEATAALERARVARVEASFAQRIHRDLRISRQQVIRQNRWIEYSENAWTLV